MNRPLFGKMTIGERLRWVMERRQVKQVHLAEQIGITQAAISNLVTDSSRKPSAPTLLKICDALECSPHWLITGEGEPHSYQAVTGIQQVELLSLFKRLSEQQKTALLATARAMLAR